MSYQRKAEDNRRLKKTYEETRHGYGPGVWYDKEKDRYIKLDFTNTWLKTHCRRVTRRRLKKIDAIGGKSYYKKYYDYWWDLY